MGSEGDAADNQKYLKLFQQRFAQAESNRRIFDDKCEQIDKHYEPWNASWNDDVDENTRTAHIFHIMETMSANMVEADPDFDVQPREHSDETQAKLTRSYLRYALERDGWSNTNMRFIREGNRYGLAVLKTFWEYDERVDFTDVEEPHSNTLFRLLGRTETNTRADVTVLRDDVSTINVDRQDFWWQPGANDCSDAEWVLHRSIIPRETFESLQEDGVYFSDKISGSVHDSSISRQSESAESREERDRQHDDGIELIEMWDRVRDKLVTVANRSTVVRCEPNPMPHGELPFSSYTPIPKDGHFEGTSPVEILMPLQKDTWQMESDRKRSTALTLNPVLLVDRALKGATELKIQAGARIYARPDQIQQLQIAPNTNGGFSEVQSNLGYMQQVSGVSPFISGADPSGYGIDNKTATGVNQLASAAGRRIGFHIQMAQETIRRVATQSLQLANKYLDSERRISVVGKRGVEWVTVDANTIPSMFDVKVLGSTESITRNAERQQGIELLQYVQAFHGMPTANGSAIDISPIVRKVVDSFDIDPDLVFPEQTEEQQMQIQAEAQQAEAMAMQQQGDAQMADPNMQMLMQQQSGGAGDPNDLNGDGSPDMSRRLQSNINIADLAPEAQADFLEQMGHSSEGIREEAALDRAERMAKLQHLDSQTKANIRSNHAE